MIVKGQIVAMSHILYVKPKIFFIEIHFNDQQHFLIIKDRNLFQKWQSEIIVRSWVEINCSAVYKLYEGTEFETQLMELTADSRIEQIKRPDSYPGHSVQNKKDNLLTFEGCVTEDVDSSLGFYKLDENIVLCLTNLNLVSNIPLLKKGDKIRIYHAHKLKISGSILIYACGRTLITLSNSDSPCAIFPKFPREVSEDFLQHYALNQCCSIHVLHSLQTVRQTLLEKLETYIPRDQITNKISQSESGILASVVECISKIHNSTPKNRSLPREFLCHDKICPPIADSEFPALHCWKLNPEEIISHCSILDLWQPQAKVTNNQQLYWLHEIGPIRPNQNSTVILVGLLRVGSNGRFLLEDKHGQLECILDEGLNDFPIAANVNRVAIVTEFTVHRESFTVSSDTFTKVYLTFSQKNIHFTGLETRNSPSQPIAEDVSFTLLHKGHPQALRLTTPAKREVLGYFLVVSLSQSNLNGLTKKPRLEENVSTTSCIFFMNGVNSMRKYIFLRSGRVYGIRGINLADYFIEEPNSIPCLKDVSKDLRCRIFILPPETDVLELSSPLTRDSIFMKDVLDVADCFRLEICDEIVSIRGRIVDRFHIDPRFSSEKGGGRFSVQHQTWFGIPGNKKIVIKISSAESQQVHKSGLVSVYLSLQDGQIYPLGIHNGAVIEVSWLLLKKSQDSNRVYGISTGLSGIRILQLQSNSFTNAKPVVVVHQGRKFFAEVDRIVAGETFSCVFTVRFIHKVSVRAVCSGCGSSLVSGSCSYVGCHWVGEPKIDLKAWCTVEDGSGRAVIYFHGDICRRWMKLPPQTWNLLEHYVKHKGELLYLCNKPRLANEGVASLFSVFCEISATLRGPFNAEVRKFRNSKDDCSREPYYLKECPTRRLFCLEINQLDAVQSALELLKIN